MTKNTILSNSRAAIESSVPGRTDYDETDSLVAVSRDIYKDARGFTYRAVRFCDLNRICDK